MNKMVKIQLGINTSFTLRRWTQPKQWMELIYSKFELDSCELSLDLLDPMLREPTKTEYMQEILELGDIYPINLVSCRTGETKYKDDMLLHPNFGHRINSVQWYEKAIDIAAYTNSSFVGGYFGGLVTHEHTDTKLMGYLISFLIDGMSYLSSIAYTAGLYGFIFEPFSLVPDGNENMKLNLHILKSIRNSSSLKIKVSPVLAKHDLQSWIQAHSEDIHIIQIRNVEDAHSVKSIVENSKIDSKSNINIILNQTPSFSLSPNEALNSIIKEITEIKRVFKLK